MNPEKRRAIQQAASQAQPPMSAQTAPPVAVPAPNPQTGMIGNPPTGHPMSAMPMQPAPMPTGAAATGAAARPGRAASLAPPGTARGLGQTNVEFVGQGGSPQAGVPEVRTRGAGRAISGPHTGARIETDNNAMRRGGAVAAVPGQVTMQGRAPASAAVPVPTAGQWSGGGAIPQMMPSAATTPIADLTIVLSQHTRPGFLERQLRTLQSSTVRASAMMCFVNPVQGVQIQDALLGNIPKIRADRDMGPWMRWIIGPLITTSYVLMLDDDCIFGTSWLQHALERIHFSANQGQKIIVAAGGIVYRSDQWSDVFPIGPEAAPPEERQVDIGRGAWLMPTEALEHFFEFPRLGSKVLSIPLHFAAAMQEQEIPTITLPYPLDDRGSWGMSTPPTSDGSMSNMLDLLAKSQRGNSAAWHREEAYNCYRAAGWRPLCAQFAEQETLRTVLEQPAVDLGAPPPVVPAPAPKPLAEVHDGG